MTHKTRLPELPDWLSGIWHQYGYVLLVAGLAAAFLFVAISLLIAQKRKRLDRWVNVVTWIAVYGFSADGMWIVATQKAHVPPGLAVVVFVVGDAMMINSMIRASQRYTRTTVRDNETGEIIKPGDPGKHGRAVWLIATVMGLIVAFSSHNPVEWALRLSLPLGAALLWWNGLTADGTTRQKTTWRWTLRRLGLWAGAIAPGEEDLEAVSERRQLDDLTQIALRTHGVVLVSKGARARAKRRLTALLPAATPEVLAEVQRRVDVGARAVELTAPGTRTLLDELAAERADLARQRAEWQRQAVDAAVVARREATAELDRRVAEIAAEARREAAAARDELAAERRAAAEVTAQWRREVELRRAAEAERDAAVQEAAGGGGPAAAAGKTGGGRSWPETVALYRRAVAAADENLSMGAAATLIGIAPRTLREALAKYKDAAAADEAAAEAAVETATKALSNGRQPVAVGA